jgi:PAS domain S-box-containing protein
MSGRDSNRHTRSTRHRRVLTDEQSAAREAHTLPHQAADLLERVSDAFVALDKDWRYAYVNGHAAALFGRRPRDLIGRHIWTEFPEGVGQPFHLAYEKAMKEQVFVQLEAYYEPWGRWFENRIYPSPEGLSIFFHEITERKVAEQAAQASLDLLKRQNQVLELVARGARSRKRWIPCFARSRRSRRACCRRSFCSIRMACTFAMAQRRAFRRDMYGRSTVNRSDRLPGRAAPPRIAASR